MYMHSYFKAGMLQINKNTLKFITLSRKQLIANKVSVFQKLGDQTFYNLHNMWLILCQLL